MTDPFETTAFRILIGGAVFVIVSLLWMGRAARRELTDSMEAPIGDYPYTGGRDGDV